MSFFFNFLALLCQVLTLIILIRVILSWFSPPNNMFVSIIYHITEPILSPMRRIIPRVGPFDFAPLIAVVLLQLIYYLLP